MKSALKEDLSLCFQKMYKYSEKKETDIVDTNDVKKDNLKRKFKMDNHQDFIRDLPSD